jgi:hypothetical protein
LQGNTKECEYYIPDLLQNLDTDAINPIIFDEMLISAEAIYFYEFSDTTITTYCCQTEQEYSWNAEKALACWILTHKM